MKEIADKILFSRYNYINIQGFMITDLKLSGNELLCYALIYGFSQLYGQEYDGSLAYLSSALNVTRVNAMQILKRLVKKGLIAKRNSTPGDKRRCYYSVVLPLPVQEGAGMPAGKAAGTVAGQGADTPRTEPVEGVSETDKEAKSGVSETDTRGVSKTDTDTSYININNNIIPPNSAHTREEEEKKDGREEAARGVMQIIELYNRRVADTKQKACSIQTLSPLIRGNLVELIRKHGYDAVRDVIIKATEPGTFTAEHVNTSLKWIVDADNFGNIADGIYEKEDNNGRGEEKKAERCGSDRSDAQPLAEPHRLKRL